MSNFDKHVLAFSPTHIRFGPIQQFKDYRVLEKYSISDTLLDGNDESLVFVTIWDVPMTSWVERTDLDFKISVALPLMLMASIGASGVIDQVNWEKPSAWIYHWWHAYHW